MLCLKKLYREELLQLALILSILRVDPESYLGIDIQSIGVRSLLDLNNGSGWHTDAHTIVHRPLFIHPKNPDSMLLNYERNLFQDLNSLGRYNRLNTEYNNNNNIHAYLLNIEESGKNASDASSAGTSVADLSERNRNVSSPDPPTQSQTVQERVDNDAELTQEAEARHFENLVIQNNPIYELLLRSTDGKNVIIYYKENGTLNKNTRCLMSRLIIKEEKERQSARVLEEEGLEYLLKFSIPIATFIEWSLQIEYCFKGEIAKV